MPHMLFLRTCPRLLLMVLEFVTPLSIAGAISAALKWGMSGLLRLLALDSTLASDLIFSAPGNVISSLRTQAKQ